MLALLLARSSPIFKSRSIAIGEREIALRVFICEHCLSHWVTILILLLTGFQLLIDDWRGYILAFFAIPWVANLLMSIYRRLRVGIKHENLLAKEVEEKLE